MFIVLEGLDGAGKSTQAGLLQKYMHHRGTTTRFQHFPRFNCPVYGELIAKFLRGDFGAVDRVDSHLVSLLFAGDRADAGPLIRSWLREGHCVLLDRYVYSNIAYQCAKLPDPHERRRLRQWIWEMEYQHFNIPRPDLTVFFDVPLAHVEKKLSEERSGDDRAYLQGKQDIHEGSIDLQHRVRQQYLEQAAEDATFKVIDCSDNGQMLAPQPIFEKLIELITNG